MASSGTKAGTWRRRARIHAGIPLRLGLCFMVSLAATVYVGLGVGSNLIWLANGVLLSYLLLAPRWRWTGYLISGLAGQVAGAMIVNGVHLSPMYLALGPLNVAEAGLGAWLLRRRSAQLPRFTDPKYLVRFLACAVVGGPLVTGIVFAAARGFWHHITFWQAFVNWTATDGVGILVATPACVAILQMRRNDFHIRWSLLLPFLLMAFSWLSFSHLQASLLSLIYPLLILVLLRLGIGWASVMLLLVAGVGNWVIARQSPGTHLHSIDLTDPSFRLQVFVVTGTFMLYAISVVMERRSAAEKHLSEIVALHRMVTQNSRDIILLADMQGVPRYISEAVFSLTGWKPEETMTRGFSEVVHSDDMAAVQHLLAELHDGREAGTLEYRVHHRQGGFVWVEGSFRTLHDCKTGCTGILQVVRDITERKLSEQKLQAAYRALEGIAAVDALTGIANRRRFDETLDCEWRRALREEQALSIVLLDVDLFKLYNDTYGHLRGDSCLKQIAESAMDVLTRPGDLLTRYGGEEFAVILAATGSAGARHVAQEIAEAVRARKLTHRASPFGVVTVSAGHATLVPQMGQSPNDLIDLADCALYEAKRRGRNLVWGSVDEPSAKSA